MMKMNKIALALTLTATASTAFAAPSPSAYDRIQDVRIDGLLNYAWSADQDISQLKTDLASTDSKTDSALAKSSAALNLAAGAKTVLFGDLNYYWVADREGRSFKRLNELYAPTGQVGFLASQRVDGKLILPEAVKVLQQA